MEKSAEVIGKKEFDDVWERVSAGTAVSDVSGGVSPMTGSELAEAAAREPKKAGMPVYASPDAMAGAPAVTKSTVLPLMAKEADFDICDGSGPEVSPEEIDRLQAIMECVARSQRECCSLAGRCRGEIRRVCRAIENSARCSNQELNTQYYMLTGESFCPGSSIAPSARVSETLRNVCNTEAAVREACVEAADKTDIASLETAYLRCAKCAAKREKAAENLLGDLLRCGRL